MCSLGSLQIEFGQMRFKQWRAYCNDMNDHEHFGWSTLSLLSNPDGVWPLTTKWHGIISPAVALSTQLVGTWKISPFLIMLCSNAQHYDSASIMLASLKFIQQLLKMIQWFNEQLSNFLSFIALLESWILSLFQLHHKHLSIISVLKLCQDVPEAVPRHWLREEQL